MKTSRAQVIDPSNRSRFHLEAVLAVVFLLSCSLLANCYGEEPVAARDWPGLLGPARDGFAAPDATTQDHSKTPCKTRWELDAGQGYAGAAISNGRVALFQRQGDQDLLQLVSLEDGKPIWKIAFPATYRQGVDSDTGPRCVPQFTSDAVLAYSAAGTLHCVELGTGKKRWSRELRKEYRAEDGYFGAGSTPLLVDSMAIVNVGGKKGGGVVAVSLADGKTIWAATDAEASYASPILWSNERNSVADSSSRTVVVPTRLATYGLDPKTGAVRWQFPFGQRGPTVNAATPIITADNNLFLTASYGIGFSIAKPSLDKVEVIQKGEGIASQYATPIAVGDTVFGSDGREDGGWPNFNCIDIQTGKTVWSQPNMQICHIIGIRQGGAEARLLLIGIDGKMWYLPASREGFKPLWSTELPSGKYRALPALSKNLLVVRTSGGSNTLWRCFEL